MFVSNLNLVYLNKLLSKSFFKNPFYIIFEEKIMKVLLDIKDNKAAFIMELLNNFSFVTTKQLTPNKALFLEELKGAVDEINLSVKGKVKLQSAKDFLNEL
jgi:hypothetical protein